MKIGLYGGTFSPPHIAHVRAAKLFLEECGLQKLYVMPAGIPPHKNADRWGNAAVRMDMTCLAFGEFCEVSDYEIKKEGRSYTVETLRYLSKKHPKDDIYMLVGEDMFFSLDAWKCPDEIMKLCTVCAMRREETPVSVMEKAAEDYKNRYGAKVVLIQQPPVRMSSTQIRQMVAADEDIKNAVPEKVLEYITVNKLYKNDR